VGACTIAHFARAQGDKIYNVYLAKFGGSYQVGALYRHTFSCAQGHGGKSPLPHIRVERHGEVRHRGERRWWMKKRKSKPSWVTIARTLTFTRHMFLHMFICKKFGASGAYPTPRTMRGSPLKSDGSRRPRSRAPGTGSS
jgi:hypothetical protein